MALLAAASTRHQGATGSRNIPLRSSAAKHPASIAQNSSPVTTTTTAAGTPKALSTLTARNHASQASTTALPTGAGTTTTTVTSTTVGSGVGSSPAQPDDRTSEQGYLEPPDDTSAVYPFTADGPTQVSATWSTTTTLSLSITCPSGTQTEEGSSTVTVTSPDAQGSCQATLSEPDNQSATVTYSLTIGPDTSE
jgi:hypothetical protein